MPTVTDIKKEIADTIKKLVRVNDKIEVNKTACVFAIQTGYNKEAILSIFELLEGADEITIDSKGYARLSMNSKAKEVQDNDESTKEQTP